MTNPQYLINIYYEQSHLSGQELVSIGGVTQSVPTYTTGFYIASMPEVRISATGSDYGDALTNLLTIASSTETPNQPPLSNIKNW